MEEGLFFLVNRLRSAIHHIQIKWESARWRTKPLLAMAMKRHYTTCPSLLFFFFPESSLSQADKQPLKIMNLWITWLCAELASYGEKKKKKDQKLKDCEWCLLKKKKNDREKKEGATDFAVGLQGLARSQDKLEGVNRSSSIFFPTILAVFEMHWAGLYRVGLNLSASSQNTQALFSFANQNQMCPDLF